MPDNKWMFPTGMNPNDFPLSVSHAPNPPIPQGNIRPIQTGDQFPANRAPEGVSGLYDFIGKLADLVEPLGLTDPSNVDTPAVTRFLSPSGVPSKTLRSLFTQQFIKDATEHGPELASVAEELARRYPRIAAHTKINKDIQPITDYLAATHIEDPYLAKSLAGIIPTRIPISFSGIGINQPTERLRTVLGHEMTHVAQKLGNSDLPELYKANNELIGYHNNPFEESARETESRLKATEPSDKFIAARASTHGPFRYRNAIDKTKQLANTFHDSPSSNKINNIMDRRTIGPLTPGKTIEMIGPTGKIFADTILDKGHAERLKTALDSGYFKIKSVK